MNTQSQPYYLDEFPALIRPGVSIGMITDGIADLAVAWDDEQGRAYVDRVESITLRVDEVDKDSASLGSERLDPSSSLFTLIEEEIKRRAESGAIDLTYDRSPDPDYLRDLQLDAAE